MAVRINILGESVVVVNVLALSNKTERKVFSRGFDSTYWDTKYPCSLEGTSKARYCCAMTVLFVSPPGRHDSLALIRLIRRAQLSDVFEDKMD